jgi:hypothetical protein
MPDVEEQGMSFSLAIRIVTILSIDGKSKERANDKQLRLHDNAVAGKRCAECGRKVADGQRITSPSNP